MTSSPSTNNEIYAVLESFDSDESYCPKGFDWKLEERRASLLADALEEAIELDAHLENSSSYQDGSMFTCIDLHKIGVEFPVLPNISTKDWAVNSGNEGDMQIVAPNFSLIEDYLNSLPKPIAIVGLSCFGSLATIFKCNSRTLIVEIERVLQDHHYQFIEAQALDNPYTGDSSYSLGKTWEHRYFSDVVWS